MSHDLRYDIVDRLITVSAAGEYDLHALLDLLQAALADPGAPERALLLIDARASTTDRAADEVRKLVADFSSLVPRIERVAIVAGSDAHFGLMRMGAVLAEPLGLKALPCRDMETARTFLGLDP
jgi:hypothetical protein